MVSFLQLASAAVPAVVAAIEALNADTGVVPSGGKGYAHVSAAVQP